MMALGIGCLQNSALLTGAYARVLAQVSRAAKYSFSLSTMLSSQSLSSLVLFHIILSMSP